MYSVPIDDDRLDSLVVEVLKDWYECAEDTKDAKAIARVIKYGSTVEEYRRWKQYTGSLGE